MISKQKKPSTQFVQQALNEPKSATTFDTDHKKVPNGRRAGGMSRKFKHWYESLWGYNEGWNGNWRDERKVTQNAKVDMIDIVATQLDLSTYQKEKAKGLIRQIDGRFCNGKGGLHMLVICICQIVVEEDEDCIYRSYHPLSETRNDRQFHKIVDEFGFELQQVSNSIQSIRHELGVSY